MKRQHLETIALLAVPLIVFLGLLLRQFPPGADSYYFLINARDGIIVSSMPFVFQWIALHIPTNISWQIVPPFFAFLDVVLLMLIGKELKFRNWQLVGLALVLAPAFIMRAAIFEDDLIGYTMLLFTVLMFFKNKILGALALIPMMLVWKGWVIGAALLLFMLLPEIIVFPLLVLGSIVIMLSFINVPVAEQVPVTIGVALIFMPFMFPFVEMIKKEIKVSEDFFRWAFFSVVLGMLAIRFLVLAALPLALLFAHSFNYQKYRTLLKTDVFLKVVCIALVLSSLLVIPFSPPSTELMVCIQEHPEALFDWSLGYYAIWFGIDNSYTPGSPNVAYTGDINYVTWKEDCQNL